MDIFKEHVDLILDANLTFYHPKDFVDNFDIPKKEKKILLTIDAAALKSSILPFVDVDLIMLSLSAT